MLRLKLVKGEPGVLIQDHNVVTAVVAESPRCNAVTHVFQVSEAINDFEYVFVHYTKTFRMVDEISWEHFVS